MLSKRLVFLRKQNNLNQDEMAQKVGVARTTYAMYEQGRRSPDYEILNKLADFFDVTTDYLLGRSNNPKKTEDEEFNELMKDPQTNIMFEDWINMSIEQRQEALNYIKYLRQKEKQNKEK